MNEEGEYCGEKFTKCSLHTGRPGCIIGAIYWMAYALSNPYTRIHVLNVGKRIRQGFLRITLSFRMEEADR